MSELLEQAVARVRALPSDQQDELARVLLRIADAEQEPVPLSVDELAAIAAFNRGPLSCGDKSPMKLKLYKMHDIFII